MKKLRIPMVYRNSKELEAFMALSFETYAAFLKERGLTQEHKEDPRQVRA
jgi:hypothetical protein